MRKIKYSHFTYSSKNIVLFCIIWLCIGFTTGTLILIYPVHWITDYSSTNNWSSTRENITIKFVILLFIILSFFLSILLFRVYYKIRTIPLLITFFSVLVSTTVFALWLWFNPTIMSSINQGEISSENTVNARFSFGPYPTESVLKNLKENDYSLVISLLHPSVIPFEPKLIKDEEIATSKTGIKYINIPLLPWVSDNVESIKKLKEIIRTEKGKIYVHCYLGKDRVNVVKNIIKKNRGIIDKSSEIDNSRQLTEINDFERGNIIQLEPNVFLTPYPTDEEYFTYILTGSIKNVVNLMNPTNKEELALVEKEKKLLAQYNISFHHFPLSVERNNSQSVMEIIRKIEKLQRPIVIHSFSSNDTAWEVFEKAYKNKK